MSGCYPTAVSFCKCDCHKPSWMGVNPPICVCNCHVKVMNLPYALPKNNYVEKPNEDVSPMVKHIQSLEERIKDLEYRVNAIVELPTELDIRLEEVDRKLDKAFNEFCVKPHKCPICEGSTFCSEGMMCVPCDGTGILWG